MPYRLPPHPSHKGIVTLPRVALSTDVEAAMLLSTMSMPRKGKPERGVQRLSCGQVSSTKDKSARKRKFSSRFVFPLACVNADTSICSSVRVERNNPQPPLFCFHAE